MASRGDKNSNPIIEKRQQRMLALLNRGVSSDAELSRALGISKRTVSRDKRRIYRRMVAAVDEKIRRVHIGQALTAKGLATG
jgi:DNA-binding NarL/FixJ family response regulator